MYDLPYHKEKNEQAINDLIKEYPLAFLSGVDAENRPIATQIPLFSKRLMGSKCCEGTS
jgi:transcriptional regulator